MKMLEPRDTGPDGGTPMDAEVADGGDDELDAAPIPECARDTECASGEVCLDSACAPGCATTGCAGSQVCDPSGHCFSDQIACTRSADCNPPHQVCLSGSCAPGCAVGGGGCTENRICDPSSGYCQAAPKCTVLDPCPDRQFTCLNGACVRRCDAPGAAPCLGTSTCNVLGRCAGTQLGDFCSSDDSCTTGLCFSTTDPPATFCTTPCGRSADCPLGFSCLPTGNGYRICMPEGIFNMVTFDTRSGEACENPGNVCQSTICEGTSMTCTERCGRDEHCSAFATGCIVRQQTLQGQPVFSQECAPGPGTKAIGEVCTVNTDCASGICNKYENTCAAACCTQTDCPAGQSCLVYDLNNQTVITLCQAAAGGVTPIGMPCTTAAECESGTCTPRDPSSLAGPKICSVRCCTHDDCSALTGGYCHPIPGVLPGTQASTCFPR